MRRGYRQLAFFASLDFDIIPKVLTVTAGTRHYRFDNNEKGAVTGSFGCYEAGLAPCLASATNIDAENLRTTYTGFKSRANLTWHILPDVLAYYTWSQGFRPGAFNRNFACYIPDSQGIALYCSPLAFTSDNLTNHELGWKTEFLDHRLQWNGALYQENWNNVQIAFFDPGVLGNVGFGTNGPNYRIRGLETSFIATLVPGLTAQGAASWNHSEQTNSPFLIANNPELLANPASKAEYGQPILSVQNPYGPIGGPSCQLPADAVQRALAVPVGHQLVQRLRAGGRYPHRTFVHAVQRQPDAVGGIEREHHAAAVRESPDHAVRRIRRGLQGCVVGGVLCPEPDECKQEHLHLDQPVRRCRSHHASAGPRGQNRLQVVI